MKKNVNCDDIFIDLNDMPEEIGCRLPDPGLLMYYKNYKDRTIWLDKDIDDSLYGEIRLILQWNKEDEVEKIPIKNRKPITILIHSYGGNLDAAFSMIDIMSKSKTPIKTVNIGACMSSGGLILLSGHKGMRYAMPLSQALVHEGVGGSCGTYSQVQAQSDNYKKMMGQMKQWIIDHSKITQKVMDKWKNSEVYMFAEDQLKYGLVDHIVENLTEVF